MSKNQELDSYIPKFSPKGFAFASSPKSSQLNSIQESVYLDLLSIYGKLQSLDNAVGVNSTRVATDASNFTINTQRLNAERRLSRYINTVCQRTTSFHANWDKLRIINIPLVPFDTYGAWLGTNEKVYPDPYNNLILGSMTSISHRLADPNVSITLTATDSDGNSLILDTNNSEDIFDQSKETCLVLFVDRAIESEEGTSNAPYEEIAISISSTGLSSSYNALNFEFGLPMDIDSLQVAAANVVDENSDVLQGATINSKFYDNGYLPLEDITRRIVFIQSTSGAITFNLRSTHWIPVNYSGTVKKRYIFPIYNIDAINYSQQAVDSLGIISLVIPRGYVNVIGMVGNTFFGAETLSSVVGFHIYPTFVRDNSQSNAWANANIVNATALTNAENNEGNDIIGASNTFYIKVKLSDGTYVPRIEALDLVYLVS